MQHIHFCWKSSWAQRLQIQKCRSFGLDNFLTNFCGKMNMCTITEKVCHPCQWLSRGYRKTLQHGL